MSLLLTNELGNERISREMLMILSQNLNAELVVQDAKWTTLDQQLAQQLQIPYLQCTSNQVAASSFYHGHIPSLVFAPPTNYPNVSVMSDQLFPNQYQGDHYDGVSLNIIIEALIIDGPYPQDIEFNRQGEEFANKKIQRMAEAINAVVNNFRDINGLVDPILNSPRVIFSECFRRTENTQYGQDYYWQGVNLTYQVDKVLNPFG